MTRKASSSITSGRGVEHHNHDKVYRTSLLHVYPYEENVEYTPLCPYKEQVNGIMETHLKRYNMKQELKYQENLRAYAEHERKTEPKLTVKNLNYYESVRNRRDTNPVSAKRQLGEPFKGVIITFGNIQDRVLGTITKEEATAIGSDVLKGFEEAFPGFHILGASLHCDEAGAYHLHCDYLIACEKKNWTNGMPVYTGLDNALRELKYEKSPSRYPGKEESPSTYFNTYRNKLLDLIREAMHKQGIELDYGVSLLRYPWKNPSTRWNQAKYKETVELMNALSDYRLQVIDLLDRPELQVGNLESALKVMLSLQDLAEGKYEVQQCAVTHGYEVTAELLDRYVEVCGKICSELLRKIQDIQGSMDSLVKELELQKKNTYALFSEKDKLTMEIRGMERRLHNIQKEAILTEQEVNALPDPKLFTAPDITWMEYTKLKRTAKRAEKLEKLLAEAKAREQEIAAHQEECIRLLQEYYWKIDQDYGSAADMIHDNLENSASVPGLIRKLELDLARANFNNDILSGIIQEAQYEHEQAQLISSMIHGSHKEPEQRQM